MKWVKPDKTNIKQVIDSAYAMFQAQQPQLFLFYLNVTQIVWCT